MEQYPSVLEGIKVVNRGLNLPGPLAARIGTPP